MPLLYFKSSSCISPQHTFPEVDLNRLEKPVDNRLQVNEPDYTNIPAGVLRRMGRAIRMGVGAALPLLKQHHVDGIIIGTANGGMEDCIKFLNQIIEYDEGRLTPGNFVGSTPNAIAAQLGLITSNKQYNITHVQSGFSFENALLDAVMMIENDPSKQYLVGGLDEISAYNYNIDWLAGWFKSNPVVDNFYSNDTPGSVPGEGSAMFVVGGDKTDAFMSLDAIGFFHADNASELQDRIRHFMEANHCQSPAVFLSGEEGDSRFASSYSAIEQLLPTDTTIARFKHMSGQFATASALAVFFAGDIMLNNFLPAHMMKTFPSPPVTNSILIYNRYKQSQHSLILLSRVY